MSGVAGKSPNHRLEREGGGRGGGGAAGTAIGLSQLILARMKESSRKPFRKRTLALCRASWCRLSRSAFVQMESRRAMSVPLSWLLWDALALDFTHTDANCTFTLGYNSNEQFMHVRRCSHKHAYKSCMITHTVVQLYTRALAIIMRARTHTHTHAHTRHWHNYMRPHTYTHTTSQRNCWSTAWPSL